MRNRLWIFLAVFCRLAMAQTSPEAPAFEVASVRASEAGMPGESLVIDTGTLRLRNVTLRSCIQWAYGVRSFQISGPAWLAELRLDITTKASDAAPDARLRLMLRTLLKQRFGLQLHREQKELPVYVLTVAKNGPKFRETTSEGPVRFSGNQAILVAERATMSDVATRVSEQPGRPVIDKTDLVARYDFRFDVTPYLTAAATGGGEPGVQLDPISLIFTGFQEQLGLKLEAGKDTVDMLVVDAATKVPSEN